MIKINQNIISKRAIRYSLFFLSVIILVYSAQIFFQNFNMNQTVEKLKQQQYELSWQTYWLKNYYEPYLKSKYSTEIFKHKNAIPADDEILVSIVDPVESVTWYVINNKQEQINITWKEFFSSILKKAWF